MCHPKKKKATQDKKKGVQEKVSKLKSQATELKQELKSSKKELSELRTKFRKFRFANPDDEASQAHTAAEKIGGALDRTAAKAAILKRQ